MFFFLMEQYFGILQCFLWDNWNIQLLSLCHHSFLYNIQKLHTINTYQQVNGKRKCVHALTTQKNKLTCTTTHPTEIMSLIILPKLPACGPHLHHCRGSFLSLSCPPLSSPQSAHIRWSVNNMMNQRLALFCDVHKVPIYFYCIHPPRFFLVILMEKEFFTLALVDSLAELQEH